MTVKKTAKPVKNTITISEKTADLLVDAVMKMKLWATPEQIKYVRRTTKEPKDLLIIGDENA